MVEMLLQVIITFLICASNASAEKNFWDNEVCQSDSDCTGLTSCHSTFGCTLDGAKVGLVMLAVFLSLCVIAVAAACFCRRHFGNSHFIRSNNQYIHPNPVIVTNPPTWNQQPMGPTTVYPNFQPTQMYVNPGNPHMWNQNQMGIATTVNPQFYPQHEMDRSINAGQLPSAPDARFGYGISSSSYYSKQ